MKRRLSLWLPVILWAGLIYFFSSIPSLRITDAWYDFVLRKLAHMFVFGVLALLLSRALRGSTTWPIKTIFVGSLLTSILYACSDEYHQSFVQGRVGSWKDIGLDSIGSWLALRFWPKP